MSDQEKPSDTQAVAEALWNKCEHAPSYEDEIGYIQAALDAYAESKVGRQAREMHETVIEPLYAQLTAEKKRGDHYEAFFKRAMEVHAPFQAGGEFADLLPLGESITAKGVPALIAALKAEKKRADEACQLLKIQRENAEGHPIMCCGQCDAAIKTSGERERQLQARLDEAIGAYTGWKQEFAAMFVKHHDIKRERDKLQARVEEAEGEVESERFAREELAKPHREWVKETVAKALKAVRSGGHVVLQVPGDEAEACIRCLKYHPDWGQGCVERLTEKAKARVEELERILQRAFQVVKSVADAYVSHGDKYWDLRDEMNALLEKK